MTRMQRPGIMPGRCALFIFLPLFQRGSERGWACAAGVPMLGWFRKEGSFPMALIVPKFRRDSWYGRLYLKAYGADRGWLVRLRRMTFSTGFGYAPYPTLTAEMPEAEQLMALCGWRAGREDAYERCLTFLHLPPPVQPFVEDGAKVSICPTFWKIVFALFTYCPLAVIRAMWNALVVALRATFTAIANAFRWTGRRFGRPFAWAGAGALVLTGYATALYGIGWTSDFFTGKLMPRQGISQHEAWEQDEAAKRIVEREETRQHYLATCTRRIRGYVEYAKERTAQPDLECPPDSGRVSHEEYARQCVAHDELRLKAIERLESGNFTCTTDDWSDPYLQNENLFQAEADRKALATWLGQELRKVFADELKVEIASRERRLAEARKRDAEVAGTAVVPLIAARDDAAELYRRFTEFCRYNEYAKAWEMVRGSSDEMTNATCATLAGLFSDQIADAQSAIRWHGRRAWVRENAKDAGLLVMLLLGIPLALTALIILLNRYGQPILRAFGWLWDRVLWPIFEWMVIIALAPIWVPARYVLWPALKLIGRAWILVWDSAPVRFTRHAIDSVFTAIGNGIRRFFAAIGQVLADTWHLIRAFASAKWERLCPFIQWE